MASVKRLSWTALGATAALCGGCRMRDGSAGSPVASIPRADWYVATNGNDSWSGKLPVPDERGQDGPFATLERARDEIRRARTGGRSGPFRVLVRGGTYVRKQTFVLEKQDSGMQGAPVVYQACPGEEVRLAGGPAVAPENFTPVTDAGVVKRLPAAATERVLQADLHALGITELGRFPVRFRGAPVVPELFFNDRRMSLARWPNDEWATIAAIIAPGARPRTGDKSKEGGVFEYSGDRPAGWDVERGVWLRGYWCYDWYSEVIRVKSVDAALRRIQLAAPAVYSVRQGNPSPRRYYAFNLLEELDRPGEYYIDRTSGLLYFWPPGDLAGARIVLSTLTAAVVALRETSHVLFRGFVVEAGLGNGIEIGGGVGNRIEACEVRNLRQLGIHVRGGVSHRIEACDVYDTGTGGITLAGGDRKTLEPAGHEAVNNHIHHFSRHQLTYANALTLQGVGNRATHNLIHDAPHQAVSIAGNDHVFELNEVHRVCTETDDCGACYKGRNPSCRGNTIRYNFWHHIGSPRGHGNAAIYFDDGDGGDTVFGNIFFRCGDPGRGSFGTVFSHGGHDNLAENNIFIECKRALGSAPWNDSRWKSYIAAELWQTRLLKEVDITKPPYTTRYPRLIGFTNPQPGGKRINRAVRNVFFMCADVSSGNWRLNPAENWVTDRDPGFVDVKNGHFGLRSDSAVYANLPGFNPIPFGRIGLYADTLRPHPPARDWNYPPPKPLPPLNQKKAAARKPRVGPPPVLEVRRTAGRIRIDGAIGIEEWGRDTPGATIPLTRDVNGSPAPKNRLSRAWLAYDDRGLYLAVENDVHPRSPLNTNVWGASDAVEVALRALRKEKPAPIAVLRGYGNGFLRFGTTPNGDDEPEAAEPGGILYQARMPAPDRWTAELFIPFATIGIDPAKSPRIAFSLTVRKAADNLWLMWEGTRGHSYDVDRAGFLQLVR